MALVWDNFNRGGSEKLAMLALADWCNDQGGSLHPSISTIAKKINVSESQARRIIHGFINEGFLTVIANHGGGNPGQSRHYMLNIEKLSTSSANNSITTSMDATPSICATPSMDARDPLHGCARPLAPMTPEPSLTINKPSLKEKINKKENTDSLRDLIPDVTDQTFSDFITLRKAKKSPLTLRAIEGIRNESIKAGISLEAALIECCARGWIGFKAEWINKNQQAPPPYQTRQQLASIAARSIFGNNSSNEKCINGEVIEHGTPTKQLG